MPYLTGEKTLADIIAGKPNISVKYNCKIISFAGDNEFKGVAVLCDNAEEFVDCDGCFIAIGLIPNNASVQNAVDLDKYGYIISDESCTTKESGIYAAGDCRTKKTRQITTATADGASAALAACRYIDGR